MGQFSVDALLNEAKNDGDGAVNKDTLLRTASRLKGPIFPVLDAPSEVEQLSGNVVASVSPHVCDSSMEPYSSGRSIVGATPHMLVFLSPLQDIP